MSEEAKTVQKKELSPTTKALIENLSNPDWVQKYILGYKKNGQGRALYDVVKDYTKPKHCKKNKSKKHKQKNDDSAYGFYVNVKKKKKHKKHKHWNINDD